MKKIEKEKKVKKVKQKKPFRFKEMFDNENYGNGLRCVIICALAVILVVGVNLFVNALPTAATNLDISTSKIHSISEETEEKISQLSEKVDVYLVCEEGEEDRNTVHVLNLYADLSDNLNVSQVDPALSPEIIEQYTGETDIDNNSVLVVSGERRQVLAYSDYFASSVFVLEDYLNSAIDFVTSDDLDKVYALTGHGEREISDNLLDYMGLDGYTAEEINLVQTGGIPEDAKAVIVNGLTQDITEGEAEILLDYMKNGGKLLLITGYSSDTFTNLEEVTGYYGARLERGYIVESDESRYAESTPTYVMPYIYTDGTDVLTDGVEYVLMPNAKGIVTDEEVRDGLDVTTILETSDTAGSLYTNIFNNSQEVIEGPFKLGVSFEEETDNGVSKLVWFSSSYISDESVDAYVGGGNITMFLNAICWLCEDDGEASIHGKTVSTQFLTIDSSTVNLWRNIMIGAVPLTVLAVGVIVCIRRKRR